MHRVTAGKGSGLWGTHPLVKQPEPVADAESVDPVSSASESLAIDIAATLVERAKVGDMQAWARLYQDHFDGLYRHLRYLTG